jgi:hypothetical protein
MHQRDAARAAWSAAGLTKTRDAKLRRFLNAFEKAPGDCWPQLYALVRKEYPEYFEQLARPLWASGDKLLRVNLIRHADLARKEEADLIGRLTADLDVDRDRHELVSVVEHGGVELLDKVLRRKKLPDSIRLRADQRRIEIAEP